MYYADVAIPLGSLWSSSCANWQGPLVEVDSLDLAAAVITRTPAERGVGGITDEGFVNWAPVRDRRADVVALLSADPLPRLVVREDG
jgi:hypothetical protein